MRAFGDENRFRRPPASAGEVATFRIHGKGLDGMAQMSARRTETERGRPPRARPLPTQWVTLIVTLLLASGCSGTSSEHPWLVLDEEEPNRIIESSGYDSGQLVLLMPENVSPDEALELGRRIQAAAPEGATVNARLFNDELSARNWRTAPEQWVRQHLLVVVQRVPDIDLDEVRWVGPGVEELVIPADLSSPPPLPQDPP